MASAPPAALPEAAETAPGGAASAAVPKRPRLPARVLTEVAALLLAVPAALLLGGRFLVRRPSVLVACVVLLVCVPAGGSDADQGVSATPADLASVLLVVAVGLRVVCADRPLPRGLFVPLAAVVVTLTIATVASRDPAGSLTGEIRFLQVFVLVPVAVLVSLRDRWDVRLLLSTLLGAAALQGAVGCWQYLTESGATYDGRDIRAVGTFGALDVMGMSTVVSYGLLVALGVALVRRGWARTFALLFAAALLLPLAFSLSRGAWLAVGCAVPLMTLAAKPRAVLRGLVVLLAAAVVLIGGFGVGSQVLGDRLDSLGATAEQPDQSVSDRYALWNTAVGIFSDHPVTGVGPRGFPDFRDSHAPLELSAASDAGSEELEFTRQPLLSPHNQYLLVLSEQGLLGALAFVLLLAPLVPLTLRRVARARGDAGRAPPGRRVPVAGVAASGLATWLIVDFLYADVGGPDTVLTSIVLGLALWWAYGNSRHDSAAPALPGAGTAARRPDGSTWASGTWASGEPFRRGTGTRTHRRPPASPPRHPAKYGAGEERDAADAQSQARRGWHRLIRRAAVLSAALTAAGRLLGLLRDLLLARFFGATGGTDAFLVAWTVPETAAPLLIEDSMAFLMVPAFTRALQTPEHGDAAVAHAGISEVREVSGDTPRARDSPQTRDGEARDDEATPREAVRQLVRATLPRIALTLALLAGFTALAAPLLVAALAPGLEQTDLAVRCTRLTAVTVLLFGITGYLSAALRAHHVFGTPASIYVAYNAGILAALLAWHSTHGVRAAAEGVAFGALLMVLVQLPGFVRRTRRPAAAARGASRTPRGGTLAQVSLAAFVPIAAFTLARQAQVFVERFLASTLDTGTISHLNYATKIAQVPMALAMIVATVTFPMLARHIAVGDLTQARHRVEQDLGAVTAVVLLGTAFLVACASPLVHLLLQRGAFTAADTAATASVLRLYSLGLLGQALVGALVRPFFSATSAPHRDTTNTSSTFGIARSGIWYPAACMLCGLLLTAVLGVFAARAWGAGGIALANAAGISAPALLLLFGLRNRVVPVSLRTVGGQLARCLFAAALSCAGGWAVNLLLSTLLSPLPRTVAVAAAVASVFAATGALLQAREILGLAAIWKRRTADGH